MPVIESYTNAVAPSKPPALLNCNCPSVPPGVPLPLPVPRHVPFTETHPPETAMPPENVDVEMFVTARLLSVVVPKFAPLLVLIVVFVIDPPFIVGLFIEVLVSWSIR